MTRVEEFDKYMRECQHRQALKAWWLSLFFTANTVLVSFVAGAALSNGNALLFMVNLLLACINIFGAIDNRWRYVRLRA